MQLFKSIFYVCLAVCCLGCIDNYSLSNVSENNITYDNSSELTESNKINQFGQDDYMYTYIVSGKIYYTDDDRRFIFNHGYYNFFVI